MSGALRKISVAFGREDHRSSSRDCDGRLTPSGSNHSTSPHPKHRHSLIPFRRHDTSSESESESDIEDETGISKNAAAKAAKKAKKRQIKARLSMDSPNGETEEKFRARMEAAAAKETDGMRMRT
ncbi:hypothetical protein LTR66_017684 [Elasticomyces elasticus]|nr:hypothetical protein LTR66_017684 [Elasticomyces elasticus]